MYYINQAILDEVSKIKVEELDEWGMRLLEIMEEEAYNKEVYKKEDTTIE